MSFDSTPRRPHRRIGRRALFSVVPVGVAALVAVTAAPRVDNPAEAASAAQSLGLAPLSAASVPRPPNIDEFVRDRGAAIRLGKALYWEMQAGSDGRTACATCHFNAGADSRSRNTIGTRDGSFDPNPPNHQLAAADFPFRRLADPNDRNSQVLFDTANVSGSQGVHAAQFESITDGNPVDNAGPLDDPVFNVSGAEVRRVTGRNTPSNINAIFNFRSFHDGRAQNVFNGVNPFGERDADAQVGRVSGGGDVQRVEVRLSNASLASQAVGPPNNDTEMAAAGRSFPELGRKLLSLQPLARQEVSSTDSVLGSVAASGGGLTTTYSDMIREAFEPAWWDADGLLEQNFSLYWGLAIQEYESTLVSDDTPFDRFMAGDANAMSAQAQEGMDIFDGAGGCTKCHLGPELTSASVANVQQEGVVSQNSGDSHDTGFNNIGVRPTADDPGNGGEDPFGNSLSETRLQGQQPDIVQGTFKVPGLRNVALTAPYFHTGGYATLRQVVDFYNRGGNFDNAEKDGRITTLGLTEADKDALVAFLEALTDDRVQNAAAPFDHPQLFVPAGAQTNPDGSIATDANGRGVDCFLNFPATGSAGGAAPAGFLAFVGPPCATPPAFGTPAGGTSGGSSETPAATTPQTSGQDSARARLRLRVLRIRARGRRLEILARCSEACTLRAVARQGRRVVGRGGPASAQVRPSRRIVVRLRRVRAGRLRVAVSARTADGRRVAVGRTVRLRATRRGR